MKQYKTDIENIPKIRKMFLGYIFRREENGLGIVKCSEKQKARIESKGIELTELI